MKNNKSIGFLPVSTWRISQGNVCSFCNGSIDKGYPYLEEDYYEECQNYCITCAVKYDRNLTQDSLFFKIHQEK